MGDGGLEASPFGSGGAQGAEGGGVAAGFGGEVAAEAEHVGPGAEAEVCEVFACAEGPGGADHLPGVVGEGHLGEFGEELQGAVEGAGRGLCSFGCVLGDVRGNGSFGQLPVAVEVGGADGADVELSAEGKGVDAAVDEGAGHVGGGGGGADGVGEEVGGGPGRGGVSPPSGPSRRITAWK